MGDSYISSGSNTTQPPLLPSNTTIQLQNQLISVKLNDSNYLLWKMQVYTAVRGYGLEGFLNGTTTIPPEIVEGSINPDFLTWQRQDQLLASWLLSSLLENLLVMMVGLSSSREIWKTLEANFSSQTAARKMQYKLQLSSIKKGSLSIREYVNKVKTCCDMLASAGQPISDEDQAMYVLTGLGSDFDPVVVAATTRSESLTLRDILPMLLSYETRLESANFHSQINTKGSSPTVNLTQQQEPKRSNWSSTNYQHSNFRGRGQSSQRGARGRFGSFRGRGGRGFRQNNKLQCQICGYTNHTAEKCYYRFDSTYGSSSVQPQSNASNSRSFQAYSTVQTGDSSSISHHSDSASDASWYADTGASNHVTNELANLNIASDFQGGSKVQVGNGTGLYISHIGNSSIKTPYKPFLLKNLLHVPQITKNLISVSQFALDNSVYFEFHPKFCVVKDQDSHQVLLQGSLKDGLYKFDIQLNDQEHNNSASRFSSKPMVFLNSSDRDLDSQLLQWHLRLGHPAVDVINKVSEVCNLSLPVNKNFSSI